MKERDQSVSRRPTEVARGQPLLRLMEHVAVQWAEQMDRLGPARCGIRWVFRLISLGR